MRAMFGLVSLLVMIAIIMLIFKNVEAPTLERGKVAQNQAQQISGRGQDGRSALQSFKVDPQMQGGRLKSLRVTEVTPGGAAEQYYGLKKGDEITSITTQAGLQKINEASNDDPAMAKDLVLTAYQSSMPIVVMRDGKSLTLPAPVASAAVPAPAPASTSSPQPPAPTETQKPLPPRNVYDQINNLKKSLQGQ